jgi:hypothetical protein
MPTVPSGLVAAALHAGTSTTGYSSLQELEIEVQAEPEG